MKHYLGIELKLADFEIKHWLFHQNEWWKPVIGWEQYYEISTLGNVRSFTRVTIHSDGRKRTFYKQKLRPGTYPNGYKYVHLTNKDIEKNYMIHKLVLTAFIGKSNLLGNHKNLTKRDNRLFNLEYCTYRENSIHYFKSKKHSSKYTGITKCGKYWRAAISKFGKIYSICSRQTEDEAYELYCKVYEDILNAVTHDEIIEIINSAKVLKSETLSI